FVERAQARLMSVGRSTATSSHSGARRSSGSRTGGPVHPGAKRAAAPPRLLVDALGKPPVSAGASPACQGAVVHLASPPSDRKETTMFTNVLVGVDGGANGRDAIALARQLADPEGKITLAHVHRGDLDPLIAMGRGLLKAEREASSRLLVDERLATGVEAELREVIALSAGAGLHGQAESQGADLLVVGSSRHGALGRALLGDNARAALNGAPCAVAIASHGYAHEQAKLATIGVAYDGSPESKAALQAVRTVAAKTGAEVQLRQVVFIPS